VKTLEAIEKKGSEWQKEKKEKIEKGLDKLILFFLALYVIAIPTTQSGRISALILALFFWIIKLCVAGGSSLKNPPLNKPILSLIAILILTTIFSTSFKDSFRGGGEIIITISSYYLLFSVLQSKNIKFFLGALLLAGFFEAVYGILQYYFNLNLFHKIAWGKGGRVVGTLDGATDLAFVLAMILPLAISLGLSCPWKFLYFGVGLILYWCTLLTFTRAACFIVTPITVTFVLLLKNKKIALIFLLMLLVVGGGYFAAFPSSPITRRAKTFLQVKESDFELSRRVYWKAGILLFKDRPLVGVGPRAFRHNLFTKVTPWFKNKEIPFKEAVMRFLQPSHAPSHCHNNFLNFACELGILGVIVYIWFIIAVYQYLFTKLKKGLSSEGGAIVRGTLGAVTAFFLIGITDFSFHGGTLYLIWFLLAVSARSV
jgi:putative inorganic carbon (HCO3(-)) transporter